MERTEFIPSSPTVSEGLYSLMASAVTVSKKSDITINNPLSRVFITSRSPSKKSLKIPITTLRNVSSAWPEGLVEKMSYFVERERRSYNLFDEGELRMSYATAIF